MSKEKKTVAVIPAAGKGIRLKRGDGKVFIKINARPMLYHTLKVFDEAPFIDEIILVVSGPYMEKARRLVGRYGFRKVKAVTKGGPTRSQSVRNGLRELPGEASIVLIHDGGRPCVARKTIHKAVLKAKKKGAACVCVRIKPTIKYAEGAFIEKTLNRDRLWAAVTPQAFKREIILRAYSKPESIIDKATDDSSLVEMDGQKVFIVEGGYSNIKVTTEEDLFLAERILKKRS